MSIVTMNTFQKQSRFFNLLNALNEVDDDDVLIDDLKSSYEEVTGDVEVMSNFLFI